MDPKIDLVLKLVMSSEIGVERTWTKKFRAGPLNRFLEIREDGLVLLHIKKIEAWQCITAKHKN